MAGEVHQVDQDLYDMLHYALFSGNGVQVCECRFSFSICKTVLYTIAGGAIESLIDYFLKTIDSTRLVMRSL